MNFLERKTILYRIISAILLLISLGMTAFALSQIILLKPDDVVLMLIAISVTSLFAILETVFILKGGRKQSYLDKIAFNENKHVNNVPLIAVIVGTVFGFGLLSLGIAVYLTREEVLNKCAMLIVMSISVYLLVNCAIYFFYLFLFRNKPLDLRDLIK